MEIVIKKLCWISLFSLSWIILHGQEELVPLEEALIELSIHHYHALLFDPSILPEDVIISVNKDLPLKKALQAVLKGTKIEFKIEKAQIFLFRRKQLFGFIEDRNSKERLISAMIYLHDENRFSVANEEGYFSFSTIQDSLKIEISYIGYANKTMNISSQEMDQLLVISMDSDLSIQDILITDQVSNEIDRAYIEQDKGSDILVGKNQSVSAIGGEPDIHQSLIRQAGVTTGADGIGGIHLRGGKQDQNLILYDGVKMYNSSHSLGVFSIFNSSILDQAKMYKNGSSGRYSGRLSSVLDVRIKNPDLRKTHASFQISSLASQINFETPLLKDKIAILASYRRTHVDPIINDIGKKYYIGFDQDALTNYYFQDVNLKLHFKLNSEQRLFLTFYHGNDFHNLNIYEPMDGFDINDNTNINWSNTMASLRWNSLLSPKTFANITLSAYDYSFNSSSSQGEINENDLFQSTDDLFNAYITNFTLRADLETILQKHHFKYGASFEFKIHNPGDYYLNESTFTSDSVDVYIYDFPDYFNLESNLYLSDKIKLSDRIILESSLYFTNHLTSDPFNEEIKPYNRIHGYSKIQWKIYNKLFLGSSIGKYVQFEHLVSASDAGFPNDVWFPSTKTIAPEESYQWDVFSNIQFRNHSLNLAVFYKIQEGILFYKSDTSLPSLFSRDNVFWDEEVSLGKANAYGFEMDYSFRFKEFVFLHASYTYNNTNYQFEDINDGASFPFSYSVPHTFAIGSNINLYKKWYLSVDWFSHSGRPITEYKFEDSFSPLNLFESNAERVSGINQMALPDAFKLSLAISTQWTSNKWFHNLSLGVQNVTNRRNVIYQYLIENESSELISQSQSGFPILPMIRYRLGF